MADFKLKSRIEHALQAMFSGPQDQIRVRDGYLNNIHVWVAAADFKGVPDYVRQDRVWEVLKATLSDSELVLVSLVMTFDLEEPEFHWALREHEMASK